MDVISNNIKYLRTKSGLSQQEFADIADVSDKAVSTWELGHKTPRMGAIEKISQYFNIPKSQLLDVDLSKISYHSTLSAVDLTPELNQLITNYNKLNDLGKAKARDYINDLTENEKYTSPDTEIERKLNA